MGADLIGYQTIFPKEFTKKEKKELTHHLNELEGLLKSPNLAENISQNPCEKETERLLNELIELAPESVEALDECCEEEDVTDFLVDLLNTITEAKKFIKKPVVVGRDQSCRTYNILGRNFISIFAGELSWGDEPEGLAYETLKNLEKIGLLTKIEELTLPACKSTHFITED